jgi:valyl-tRNA synthetase
MDKAYDHKQFEEKIYTLWEKNEVFNHGEKEGKPSYTILMPPPNANASLHAGHAMYSIEDLLIRWKRMQGFAAIWFPGMDHAGLETQSVYEKHLAKEGKSRMDFDRETLYQNIYKFVEDNSGIIYKQFKSLGFSADWKRSTFTMDEKVLTRVFGTFEKLHGDGLIYRDNYLVNYCTKCGTTLADLEVNHEERQDPLYFMRYGPFTIATVRPETKFRDTALAVNPKDPRYKEHIGKTFRIMGLLGEIEMKVIPDEEVNPEFGTGIMKVTPAHDPHDFALGKKFGLPVTPIIDVNGRMDFSWYLEKSGVEEKHMERARKYHGRKVAEARKLMVEDLLADGLMEKIDENYLHSVPVCYRCKNQLESLVLPNWFVKVGPLKEPAVEAVRKGKIKFQPARFLKDYYQWMEVMHDWPISRQTVWGIRIPIWYKVDEKADQVWVWWLDNDGSLQQGTVHSFLNKGVKLTEIEKGLQKVSAKPQPEGPKYVISREKPGEDYLPETDTFDTWFSSGQWPLVTLNFPDGEDFSKYYPTDVMGTLSEIIKFWVSRMIMFGLYLADDVPFKTVYLWSMVVDAKGQKMSKSKGNVINPSILIDKYGADALRMALVYGIAPGSRVPLAEDKVRAMRNFANKVWNISRFVSSIDEIEVAENKPNADDKWIQDELAKTIKIVTDGLTKYRFNQAAEEIYDFIWHRLADVYIEKVKERRAEALPTLKHVLRDSLKLLHPFMPFVTEAIWQELKLDEDMLAISKWPEPISLS